MIKYLLAFILTVASTTSFSIDSSKKTQEYKAGGGIQVFMVNLTGANKGYVLIQVKHSETSIDDLVIMHKEIDVDGGRRTAYESKIEGDMTWTVFTESPGYYYDLKELMLQVPGTIKHKLMTLKKTHVDGKMAANLVKLYEEQLKSGQLDKIQLKNKEAKK